MAVRDPTFWKRFSIAVHQDEAAKEDKAQAQHADLKHSYVTSHAELPSHATTPTSQTHILTTPPPQAWPSPALLSPKSPTVHVFSSRPSSPANPTLPLPRRNTLKKASPPSPARSSVNPLTRHANASQMTLGFSGRPQSRFKFWTSVTADPSNRDSWLEGQRRKQRHRAWVCWTFWICLALFVGGVVATILVLREKHILNI